MPDDIVAGEDRRTKSVWVPVKVAEDQSGLGGGGL